MSELIRCNIVRAGVTTPIAVNIMTQFDKLSSAEASSYQGANPHFIYRAITTMLPLNNPLLVLFRDHLIDQVQIDPLTSSLRKFTIIGDPQMHTLDGHWEFVVEHVRGR